MSRGEFIGRIVRLQIQRIPIATDVYRPEGILSVTRGSIDASGMLGWHEERWVVDTHNKLNPSGRGGGKRPLTIGFTDHYELMVERFGSAPLGVAGENILIEGQALSLDDLGSGLVIAASSGDLLLERPRVAAPCAQFTSFMLGLDEVAKITEIKDAVADLHDGRRGYIVTADHATTPVEVVVGNDVFLRG